MMRSAGYTHFLGGNQALMEKGRKLSKPPHEDSVMHGRKKLNDHRYMPETVPTDRTMCRRHHLIKWSNFCEDNIHIFAIEHPSQPPRTERKRSGEEGLIFDIHRDSSTSSTLNSILHHHIHCIRARLIHTCKIGDCKLYSYLRLLRLD